MKTLQYIASVVLVVAGLLLLFAPAPSGGSAKPGGWHGETAVHEGAGF